VSSDECRVERAEKKMKRKITVLALSAMLFALCVPAHAQQPKKVPHVGVLAGGSAASDAARIEALRQGLRELGYVEGKNLVIEYQYANGKTDRLTELAARLVDLKVEVIVTAGPSATRAAKQATTTIPIVMAQDSDPVGSGLVASLARPGGIITGLSRLSPELSGKQLELLKSLPLRLALCSLLLAFLALCSWHVLFPLRRNKRKKFLG
jgi:ABC-type uncharacterized transport system substrate-binding protein